MEEEKSRKKHDDHIQPTGLHIRTTFISHDPIRPKNFDTEAYSHIFNEW